jgi:hypothetical protein
MDGLLLSCPPIQAICCPVDSENGLGHRDVPLILRYLNLHDRGYVWGLSLKSRTSNIWFLGYHSFGLRYRTKHDTGEVRYRSKTTISESSPLSGWQPAFQVDSATAKEVLGFTSPGPARLK